MTAKKTTKKTASKRKKVRPGGETYERTFKGKVHKVVQTATGYRYMGKDYGSLTAVAKKITGYASVSGPRFFGTDKAGKKKGGAQ